MTLLVAGASGSSSTLPLQHTLLLHTVRHSQAAPGASSCCSASRALAPPSRGAPSAAPCTLRLSALRAMLLSMAVTGDRLSAQA